MVMVGKIGGGGSTGGVNGSAQTAADYTQKMVASGFATLTFRAAPRVKVVFKTRGITGGAKLSAESAVAGEDGSVSVDCTAGAQAGDFEVSAQSGGQEVGRVRVVVQVATSAGEISAAGRVPGAIALEIARLAKQDPRAALQLLAQHDPMVARALQMGHGSAIEHIVEPFDLARSAINVN